ncbi:MAG: hypothetical protein ACE5ID_07180, partial [Acidobacteriota bacterium]
MPESSALDLEALLVAEGAVRQEQIDRAQRVASRLQTPKPVPELLVELGQLSREDFDRISLLYRSRQSLTDILHEEGTLDDDGLAAYEQARKASRRKTDRQILVDSGLVSEEKYLRALASREDFPFVEPEGAIVDVDLLSKASIPYLEKQNVLPFRKMDGALHVIMADPENQSLIQELASMYGCRIRPCCAPSHRIKTALKTLERFRNAPEGGEGSSLQYREI